MKFKFFQFLFFAISLTFATQVNAQLVASGEPTVGCAPLEISFAAPSGTDTYFWDFGEGNAFSDQKNPTNTFNSPGTYEVNFSATDGGAVIETVTINVFAIPEVMIAQDPVIGCAPGTVTLINSTEVPEGLSITASRWSFTDMPSQEGLTAEATYNEAGSYSVNLNVAYSESGCNDGKDFTNEIQVVNTPEANFTISPSSNSCTAPYTINIENNSVEDGLTYAWDLGQGNSFGEADPPSQTYTAEGDYDISLTVTNEEGCTSTTSQRVSVGTPTATFSVPDTVCVGSEVAIGNNSSAGSYTWTVTGPETLTSNATTPQFTFSQEGVYQIALNVVAVGCTGDTVKTVFAQNVDANFTADPTYGCLDPQTVTFTPTTPIDGASYNWDFGDDSTSTETSPIHDYDADNESPYHENGEFPYTASLTVTTSAGCTAMMEVDLLQDIPLARFMPDTVSGCAPLSVEFSDSSQSTQTITNWEWIYDDGTTANFGTGAPHAYTFNEAGEYDVRLVITNDLGCPDTSYAVRVEVGTRITPDFTTDKTSVCQGEAIQFTDASNNPNIDEWHYYTDDSRSSHCYSEGNPLIPFITETGSFEVNMVVGYNGCLDSVKKADFIEVKGPIARIDYMMSCDTPNTVMFMSNSGDATTLVWDFGDTETGDMETESHDYAETGDYTVTLTAENATTGCAASTDEAVIKIRNIEAIGEVDSLQCKSQPIPLNAGSSIDVDTACFRGYTWYFNEPSIRPITTKEPSLDSDPDAMYPDTGRYQIDLVVEDVNGCKDTAIFPIIVHEAMITFEVDKDLICPGQTVNLLNVEATTTSEKIETYMWDFGDGMGMSEEPNPGSYTYAAPPGGQVTIEVSIEDDAGCPGSASQTISVYRPTSRITAGDLTICAGETVDFEASNFFLNGVESPLNFSWDFGNGMTSDAQSATATYEAGGEYSVTLNYEEQSTGCVGSSTEEVSVQNFPNAAFTAVDANGAPSLCAPAPITFASTSTAEPNSAYSWTFEQNGTGTGEAVGKTYQNAGTYDVTLTVRTTYGCDDGITTPITVNARPEGELVADEGPFCIGDNIMASVINTVNVNSFSYEFQGITFGENERMITQRISEQNLGGGNAALTLNLVGNGGCVNADEANIGVVIVPSGFRAEVGCNLSYTFSVITPGNGLTYTWDFGDGTTSNEVGDVIHKYEANGDYMVTLTVADPASGCSGSTTLTVMADRGNGSEGVLPNAFTPDQTSVSGDDNGIFRLIGVGENATVCSDVANIISFNVYNRWGTNVFSSTSLAIDQGWNGTYKGELQPAGVYLYNVEVEYVDGSQEVLKGDVTLVR